MSVTSVMRLPREIRFGAGTIALTGPETAMFGTRALVVTDENIINGAAADRLLRSLADSGIDYTVFTGTEPDLPLDCVYSAVDVGGGPDVDVVIGFGGGSSLDLAKLVSILSVDPGPIERFYGENLVQLAGLPVVAVPTTAGTGSEVTPVAVVTDPRRRLKVGVSSPQLIPHVAICDPEATVSCPPSVTAFAGIDALIHAVEAYCAPAREFDAGAYPGEVFRGENWLTGHYALAAASNIAASLERAIANGEDLEARAGMLLGSLCAGLAFAHAGTATAHALQYPVGASTHTPHGLGVGLLAPYTLEYTRLAAEAALAQFGTALGISAEGDLATGAIDEIERLARAVGIPASLAAIGVTRDELPGFASEAAAIERLLKNSPQPLGESDLLAILEAALQGDRKSIQRPTEAKT